MSIIECNESYVSGVFLNEKTTLSCLLFLCQVLNQKLKLYLQQIAVHAAAGKRACCGSFVSEMCWHTLSWRRLTSEISVFSGHSGRWYVQKCPANGFDNTAKLCFSKEKFKCDTPELVLSCMCQQTYSAEVTSYLVQA